MKRRSLTRKELESLAKSLEKSQKQNLELKQKLLLAESNIKDYENYYSYKLGKLIINSGSLLKILSLPFNIYKLNRQLKLKRSQVNLEKMIKRRSINTVNIKASADGKFGKLVVILDEISFVSWGNEFQIFPLNRNDYVSQIKSSTSQAVFLESCWNGNFGKWEYAFTSPGLKHANAQALLKAIKATKERDLPLIFWNKEDPMHYDKFLPIAKQCDIIFTTDANKVADYKKDIPNAKVGVLPFAANIHLCNPKDRFRNPDSGSICFAGSYYSVGHDHRKQQMDNLLPVISKFNGVIYDRMSEIEGNRYSYPRKYKKYIQPAIPFTEMVDTYKKFKVFLNVNTITDSPTMMSRRVYELLACGTPVISAPSKALEMQFPGIVQIANNAREAKIIAKKLLNDQHYWNKISHTGYREVMLKHTYENRAHIISNALGSKVESSKSLVSILMATNRPQFIERIVENIARQTHQDLEAIFILEKYSQDDVKKLTRMLKEKASFLKRVEIVVDNSDNTLGKRLNIAGQMAKGEYLAKMDDDDLYLKNYFTDMLLPFKYTDAGIVGKKEVFVYLEGENKIVSRFENERHKYTDFIAGPTIMMSRETFNQIKFGDKNRGEDSSFLQAAQAKNIKIYSSDPFNFIQWRSASKGHHTWQVEDSFFTKKGNIISQGLDLSKIDI